MISAKVAINCVWVVIKRRKLFLTSFVAGLLRVWIYAGTIGFLKFSPHAHESPKLMYTLLFCCISYVLITGLFALVSDENVIGMFVLIFGILPPVSLLSSSLAIAVWHLLFPNMMGEHFDALSNMRTATLSSGLVVSFYCVLGFLLEVAVNLSGATRHQTGGKT